MRDGQSRKRVGGKRMGFYHEIAIAVEARMKTGDVDPDRSDQVRGALDKLITCLGAHSQMVDKLPEVFVAFLMRHIH